MAKQKNKAKDIETLKARFIAHYGVRNTSLENLHSGRSPRSQTGDFSDVKVVTPYGEIPWNEVSRISDLEMRTLMLDIEKHILKALKKFSKAQETLPEDFEANLTEMLYKNGHVSWDLSKDYIKKFEINIKTD